MADGKVPARVVKPTIEMMNRYWAQLSEGGVSRSDRILIGVEKKKDSLAMRFEDWDVREFLQRYVHQMGASERHCHELVDASKPCRLYMDLDSKLGHGGPDCSDWTGLVHRIHHLLLSELGLLSSSSSSGQAHVMLVWSCHRQDKQSSHVYYPNIWFDSAHNCGAFVRDVQGRFPDIMATVDVAVYPTLNASDPGGETLVKRKPLRMPLSIKYGYPNLCLTLDLEVSIGVPRDIPALDAVTQSLVAHYPSVHGQLPPEHALHTYKATSPTGTSYVRGATLPPHSQLTREEEDRLIHWLREWGRVDRGRRVTRLMDGGGVSWHIPSTYCPKKGDRHVSNHMFMWVDGDSIWFRCTDCRITFQLGVLARYILKPMAPDEGKDTCLADQMQNEYHTLQTYCCSRQQGT